MSSYKLIRAHINLFEFIKAYICSYTPIQTHTTLYETLGRGQTPHRITLQRHRNSGLGPQTHAQDFSANATDLAAKAQDLGAETEQSKMVAKIVLSQGRWPQNTGNASGAQSRPQATIWGPYGTI